MSEEVVEQVDRDVEDADRDIPSEIDSE